MTYLRFTLMAFALTACTTGPWPSLKTEAERAGGHTPGGQTATPAAPPVVPQDTGTTQGAPKAEAGTQTPMPTLAVVPTPSPEIDTPIDPRALALLRAHGTHLEEDARLSEAINKRWALQRTALEAHLSLVRAPGDEHWNRAQLELTRLNQIAAEWDDVATSVEHSAGQLAIASAMGADVKQPLMRAGLLLNALSDWKQNAQTTSNTIRARLAARPGL